MKVNPLIVVLTLFTAIVHLVVLNLNGYVFLPFVLNGLGFLALLSALMWSVGKPQARWVHYAFIAYTLVTIAAWLPMGARTVLAYATKGAEVGLVLALVQSLRSLTAK